MILEVKGLSYSYYNSKTIFHDVSFQLDRGEVLSVLGTNGAGKSTLLNCIANLFKSKAGEILLNGRPMSSMTASDVAKIVGYVPQIHVPAYAYTVREFTVMGRTPYIGMFANPSKEDYRLADEALERMGISHLSGKVYTEISGGERQQVTIARVLTQQPQIILLDEPTAHLDYGNQYRTVQMVKQLSQEGYAIVMTTHNPDHAIMLDGKVAMLNREGILSVGDAGNLSSESLSKLYGLRIKKEYDEDAKRDVCIVC
ncbi:MAG: ABC transporter ATP-binding protein [Eubacteriales bacterium]|nr:ABC transporter ATP-binding protein [Eubacteriales bacterium]